MKVALDVFEGTVTLAGTVMLPVDANATVAAVAGGLLNVTVQPATPPGASDDGVQEIPVSTEGVVVVAVPPVPIIVSALPSSVAPSVSETPTATKVTAGVIDAVATMPLAMRLVLIPVAMQI